MNYFNKQLPDMNRISQVNEYVGGYRKKIPSVRFIMLYYKDGINKEDMSTDELEEFNKELPKEEQKAFQKHLNRMEADVELSDEVLEAFGVRRAHTKMQDVLMDFMRENCASLVSWLGSEVAMKQQKVKLVEEQLASQDPATIKSAWRNYTIGWGTRRLRYCKDYC